MKLLKRLVTAGAFVLFTASSLFASPLTFEFSLTDEDTSGGAGTVTGQFGFLLDDTANQQVSFFNASFNGGSVINYADQSNFTIAQNRFTVSAGTVSFFEFQATEKNGGGEFISIIGRLIDADRFPDVDSDFLAGSVSIGEDRVSFDAAPTAPLSPVAPVPLPAGGLLLMTGLFGCAVLKRLKKKT